MTGTATKTDSVWACSCVVVLALVVLTIAMWVLVPEFSQYTPAALIGLGMVGALLAYVGGQPEPTPRQRALMREPVPGRTFGGCLLAIAVAVGVAALLAGPTSGLSVLVGALIVVIGGYVAFRARFPRVPPATREEVAERQLADFTRNWTADPVGRDYTRAADMAVELKVMEEHGYMITSRTDREVEERTAYGATSGYHTSYGVIYRRRL